MPIKISGKTLAELAMADTCPACFKIKLKLNQLGSINQKTLPFQMPMPGIFSNIDSHTKQVVKNYFGTHRKMPDWFPEIGGEIISIENAPGWQNFNVYIPSIDVKLTGALDVVFKLADGSYALGDYKTARLSETHEGLMPLYKAQLHAYSDISKALKLF